MKHREWLFTVLIALLLSASSALAQSWGVQVLWAFQGGNDGENPMSNLITDKAGNFYGTTEYGGVGGFYGTVFELSENGGGHAIKTTLYSFRNLNDGARPTSGVVFDSAGNLYGTTSDSNAGGYGEIFKLTPPAAPGAAWTETVLYHFTGGNDGAYPYGGLVSDAAGNLYGTTESSVWELSPPAESGGAWIFNLLHPFECCTADGWNSVTGLARDSKGNLYGTTEWGGAYTGLYCGYLGCGTVFEVSPPAYQGGPWKEQVIYRFGGGTDGLNPLGGLVLDPAGNVYGTTYSGGTLSGGTVFQLSPKIRSDGTWTETIIHNFNYSGDGAAPVASMIFDSTGNLYGTTEFGGNPCYFNGANYGCGVVFQLKPPDAQGGAWIESFLARLPINSSKPQQPGSSLIFDKAGNLYGTSIFGGFSHCTDDGSSGCGTVYKLFKN